MVSRWTLAEIAWAVCMARDSELEYRCLAGTYFNASAASLACLKPFALSGISVMPCKMLRSTHSVVLCRTRITVFKKTPSYLQKFYVILLLCFRGA